MGTIIPSHGKLAGSDLPGSLDLGSDGEPGQYECEADSERDIRAGDMSKYGAGIHGDPPHLILVILSTDDVIVEGVDKF